MSQDLDYFLTKYSFYIVASVLFLEKIQVQFLRCFSAWSWFPQIHIIFSKFVIYKKYVFLVKNHTKSTIFSFFLYKNIVVSKQTKLLFFKWFYHDKQTKNRFCLFIQSLNKYLFFWQISKVLYVKIIFLLICNKLSQRGRFFFFFKKWCHLLL